MNIVGLFLSIGCSVPVTANNTRSVLLSANKQLTFSRLPQGIQKYDKNMFQAKAERFQRTKLPLTLEKTGITTTDSTFSTSENNPTLDPTVMTTRPPTPPPTVVPSTQPSSSPTAAPSISPQPTNQPSSSGPTNTYKPTARSTVNPTPLPTQAPSQLPTPQPTAAPTPQPTVRPSRHPSKHPTATPTASPSRAPFCNPTMKPTVVPSFKPTHESSSVNSIDGTEAVEVVANNKENSNLVLVIGGSILGGLLFLWGGHRLLTWYVYTQDMQEKRKAMRVLIQNVPIPLSNLPGSIATPIKKNPDASVRGAYAIGLPIVTAVEKFPLMATGAVSKPPQMKSNSRSAEVEGDYERADSSSVKLSSLHSSEYSSNESIEDELASNSEHSDEHSNILSEEEFGEHSDEQYYTGSGSPPMSDVTQQSHAHSHSHSHSQSQSQSDPTRSRDSATNESVGTGSEGEYSAAQSDLNMIL
uniref:Uncharacterized protein n=1 Tax=Spumella elongata TaxID=89044 RepID=A0A7S3HER1_9STRA